MNERKKGVILSYVQVTINIVVNIAYVPILLKFLGKSEYGLYQLVGSLFSYVNIFESCMSSAVLRNYCEALGTEEQKKANDILYVAKKIYQILGIALLFVGVGVLICFREFYSNSLTNAELKEGTLIIIVLFFNM